MQKSARIAKSAESRSGYLLFTLYRKTIIATFSVSSLYLSLEWTSLQKESFVWENLIWLKSDLNQRNDFCSIFVYKARCFPTLQLTSVEDMRHNVEALEKVSAALEEARLTCDDINREEELFEWELTQFPQLEAMMQAKDPYEKLWTTAYHFSVASEQWMNGNVERIQSHNPAAPQAN